MRTCSESGCGRKLGRVNIHGWCRKHWPRHRNLPREDHVRAGHARGRQLSAEKAELALLRKLLVPAQG